MSKEALQIEEIKPGWIRIESYDRQIDVRLEDVVSMGWDDAGAGRGVLTISCLAPQEAAVTLFDRWRARRRDRLEAQ